MERGFMYRASLSTFLRNESVPETFRTAIASVPLYSIFEIRENPSGVNLKVFSV